MKGRTKRDKGYKPPRLKMSFCRGCWDIPERRPETGCPKCKRPRIKRAKAS